MNVLIAKDLIGRQLDNFRNGPGGLVLLGMPAWFTPSMIDEAMAVLDRSGKLDKDRDYFWVPDEDQVAVLFPDGFDGSRSDVADELSTLALAWTRDQRTCVIPKVEFSELYETAQGALRRKMAARETLNRDLLGDGGLLGEAMIKLVNAGFLPADDFIRVRNVAHLKPEEFVRAVTMMLQDLSRVRDPLLEGAQIMDAQVTVGSIVNLQEHFPDGEPEGGFTADHIRSVIPTWAKGTKSCGNPKCLIHSEHANKEAGYEDGK